MNTEVEVPENWQLNPAGLMGLYEDKVHLSEKSKALNDTVIIEIIEQDKNHNMAGGIHLPETAIVNCELIKGRVSSVGADAAKKNLKKDDIVLYDRFSAFYRPNIDPGTFVATKVENVIWVINE